jgi:RNA polymerase sigma factor (sigma-70 family)
LRMIHKIADSHHDEQTSDRDLLIRFVEKSDEDAFTALVRRHGSMVMGVGLRVLRHYEDAEDVCQATFLLLAKKAKTTAWRDSVAHWLYEIAYHLSLNARKAADRRNARESKVLPKTPPDVLADISARDLQRVVDEELSRLGKKHRAPLLLCCLEGKTRDEAARFLGVPLSTLISRLEKGREVLRRRLAGRGVPLSLAFAAVTLVSESVRAAVPGTLARAVSQVALRAAAGEAITNLVSVNVSALVKGGIQSMLLTKLKVAAAALLLVGLTVAGALSAGMNAPESAQVVQSAAQSQDKTPNQGLAKEPTEGVKLRATLEGHVDAVYGAAFSLDGKRFASGSKDGAIKIWDTATNKEIKALAGGEDPAMNLVFSPDGKSLASACGWNVDKPMPLKIWNVATGKEAVNLKNSVGSFWHVVFSPDGKVLAASSGASVVKLWDTATGQELGTIKEEGGQPPGVLITALAFSADGKTLVLGTREGKEGEDPVRLWNWAEKRSSGSLKIDGHCTGLRFSADGETLITLNERGDLTYWDYGKLKERKTVNIGSGNEYSGGLVMSANEKIVALKRGFLDSAKIELYDTATGKLLETVPTLDAMVYRLVFSPKDMTLAAAGWEKATETLVVNVRTVHGQGGAVRIWDIRGPVSQLKK